MKGGRYVTAGAWAAAWLPMPSCKAIRIQWGLLQSVCVCIRRALWSRDLDSLGQYEHSARAKANRIQDEQKPAKEA